MSAISGWRKNEIIQQMRNRTNAIASSEPISGVFFFILDVDLRDALYSLKVPVQMSLFANGICVCLLAVTICAKKPFGSFLHFFGRIKIRRKNEELGLTGGKNIVILYQIIVPSTA